MRPETSLSATDLESQIRVNTLQRLLETLSNESEEDLVKAFHSAGYDYRVLDRSPSASSSVDLFKLLHGLNRSESFPGIVLRHALHRDILDLGVLGFTILSCRDLRQAMQVMARYHGLTAQAYGMSVTVEGDRACSRQWIKPGYLEYRVVIDEEHIAGVWQVLRTLLPDVISMAEVDIQLDFPAPDYLALYREIFNCRITFDAETTFLSFPADWLDFPLATSNTIVEKACQTQCENMLRKLGGASALVEDVRRVILAVPSNHPVSLAEVAENLMMSPRSLERHLLAAGTSFRAIDNEVRMGLAEEYMRLAYLSNQEIAWLLSYSQPSTFYRAFKNWYGMTPREFRKTLVK